MDRVSKNRGAKGKTHGWVKHPESKPVGIKNGRALLTETQVAELRYLYASSKTTYSKLGQQFGVSVSAAHKAIKGRAWKHLSIKRK